MNKKINMEEDAVAVCLYSKYSQRCKEFMDNIREEHDIKMLCIDHKDVRDMISRDQNGYHVKTVPCIFLIYSNGKLEKYEGSDAFVWLRKTISVIDSVDVESPPSPSSIKFFFFLERSRILPSCLSFSFSPKNL